MRHQYCFGNVVTRHGRSSRSFVACFAGRKHKTLPQENGKKRPNQGPELCPYLEDDRDVGALALQPLVSAPIFSIRKSDMRLAMSHAPTNASPMSNFSIADPTSSTRVVRSVSPC